LTRKPLVIRVTASAPPDTLRRELAPAADAARRGGLVVYPTDTLYGLGADPYSRDAVLRVFHAKRRPLNRPLPVLVSSVEAAERLVVFNEAARRLAERFWPGALTLVLLLRPDAPVPRELHAGTGRLGVRMPAHRVALALIEAAGGALTGTSANRHRMPPPRTAQEAIEQLNGEVDVVVDAGPAPRGEPSTIVDPTTTPPRVIREGAVPAREVLQALGLEDN